MSCVASGTIDTMTGKVVISLNNSADTAFYVSVFQSRQPGGTCLTDDVKPVILEPANTPGATASFTMDTVNNDAAGPATVSPWYPFNKGLQVSYITVNFLQMKSTSTLKTADVQAYSSTAIADLLNPFVNWETLNSLSITLNPYKSPNISPDTMYFPMVSNNFQVTALGSVGSSTEPSTVNVAFEPSTASSCNPTQDQVWDYQRPFFIATLVLGILLFIFLMTHIAFGLKHHRVVHNGETPLYGSHFDGHI